MQVAMEKLCSRETVWLPFSIVGGSTHLKHVIHTHPDPTLEYVLNMQTVVLIPQYNASLYWVSL